MATEALTPEQEAEQAAASEKAQTEANQEGLSDVEKQVRERQWRFEGEFVIKAKGQVVKENWVGEYAQKPLSYMAMMEFTGLIGRKISEAMSGPDGLTIDTMFGEEGMLPMMESIDEGTITREDLATTSPDAFVKGFAKLASYVPDIIGEAQCIWLRVPRSERHLVVDIWSRPEDEGGLSMEQGEEMMTLFLEQNWEEVEDFFFVRLPRMMGTVRGLRKKRTTTTENDPPNGETDSLPSRLLRGTQPSTPSQ